MFIDVEVPVAPVEQVIASFMTAVHGVPRTGQRVSADAGAVADAGDDEGSKFVKLGGRTWGQGGGGIGGCRRDVVASSGSPNSGGAARGSIASADGRYGEWGERSPPRRRPASEDDVPGSTDGKVACAARRCRELKGRASALMKSLTDIFIRKPVLAIVLNVFILAVGWKAIWQLPVRAVSAAGIRASLSTSAYIGASGDRAGL